MITDGQKGILAEGHKVPDAVIESVTRKALDDAASPAPPPELGPGRKQPPGTVERRLNFKDRNYLVGAARAYCEKEGHKGFKDQRKLEQLKKLVDFESTLDHSAEITEAIEEMTAEWQSAKVMHTTWSRYKKGILTPDQVKEMKRQYPDMDLENGPPKPPVRVPEPDPAYMRGPESVFYFPSKLDAWVQEALKVMEWPTTFTQYCFELFEKFQIEE